MPETSSWRGGSAPRSGRRLAAPPAVRFAGAKPGKRGEAQERGKGHPEGKLVAKERNTGSSRSRKRSKGQGSAGGDGRRSSSRKQRREEYPDYEIRDPGEIDDQPDVMLDVPVVKPNVRVRASDIPNIGGTP